MDENEKRKILTNMDALKKKCIIISQEQIQKIKDLIVSNGANYYDAPGEADEFCCMLVLNNNVWACLSEDMDMFVYGAPRVLRYMSLKKHTFICYDMSCILEELKLTQKDFREICVLSGTDYNMSMKSSNNTDLYNALKLYKKYKRFQSQSQSQSQSHNDYSFYDWILINSLASREDIETLKKIYNTFDLSEFHYNKKQFDKLTIYNGRRNNRVLKDLLEQEGCIYHLAIKV
jgi:5'-3' exonuclease